MVPHGLLVFFPSFPLMEKTLDFWRVSEDSLSLLLACMCTHARNSTLVFFCSPQTWSNIYISCNVQSITQLRQSIHRQCLSVSRQSFTFRLELNGIEVCPIAVRGGEPQQVAL